MNLKAFLNTMTRTTHTMPIVILYVTEGCNLRCITCSYREASPNEMTLQEIGDLAASLGKFGLRHIVYSGGEPLLRRDFPKICALFKPYCSKQTLLTNGLLLERRFEEIRLLISEIIVSLDGATAETHNAIRGVASFDVITAGVRAITRMSPRPKISLRAVVQKRNFRDIPNLVDVARVLGVDRISFLAADVLSDAFGRAERGPVVPNNVIHLDKNEVQEFREIVTRMIDRHAADIESRFISESPSRLSQIVEYYEAVLGMRSFPPNLCNAPSVSTVISSTGDVRPCFFLPGQGNVRDQPLPQILNQPFFVETRRKVSAYSLERCHTCVCTLHVPPRQALADHF